MKDFRSNRTYPPPPSHYDQSTKLEFHFGGFPIAWGRWTSDNGFILLSGSLIKTDGNFPSSEPGIQQIKKELIDSSLLIHMEGCGEYDFELQEDICLDTQSTAGRLVSGHTSDGNANWKNADGISLGALKSPDK